MPTASADIAAELVALAPDVILATGSAAVAALQQATPYRADRVRTVVDPVGAGFVESLARPGGNATGFTTFEYGIGGEMAGAAQADRAGRDARGSPSRRQHYQPGSSQFAVIQAVAPVAWHRA